MRLLTPILVIALAIQPSVANSKLIVSVTQVPDLPDGEFTATIAGGSPTDPDMNPCWMKYDCELRFFTIDESWLPAGRDQYLTADTAPWETDYDAKEYRTIGEWWSAVKNKQREGTDFLWAQDAGPDPRPCVVVAASTPTYRMISGTIISNCAKGIVQARSCSITPNDIVVHLSAIQGQEAMEVDVGGVSIECTARASVTVETNTGEKIPLGGSSDATAVLDWGWGYGKSVTLALESHAPKKIPLRVKTQGVSTMSAGVLSGSAVVNISYD